MAHLGIIFVFTFGLVVCLHGQSCNGTLGDNIFAEGDFGSGPDNVLQVDPQIAPGYEYVTVVPPNDGQYTITNDMNRWPSSFDWETITDNSPDPLGYMMIVNASFSPGLFYEKEVDGLCGNTLYEFSADIYNLIGIGKNLIKPNVSFLIDGLEVYTTGDVPENEQWNTYGFTFTTAPGQTAVRLALRNNAPGGIGNDVALDNISFRPCGPDAVIRPESPQVICEDDLSPVTLTAAVEGSQYSNPAYQWQISLNGFTWDNIQGANNPTYIQSGLPAGTYSYRYLLANGSANLQNPLCRIASGVQTVTVVSGVLVTVVDTLCEGLSFTLGQEELVTSGIYRDTLISNLGCDSIVTVNLTFVPDPGMQATLAVTPPSCSYLADGSLDIEIVEPASPPFSVFVNDEFYGNALEVNGLAGGLYQIELQDRFGCTFRAEAEIASPAPFLVDIGSERVFARGESATINPPANGPIIRYDWEPGGLIDCLADCFSIDFFPKRSGLLTLSATSGQGCLATDSLFIQVIKSRRVYIPNAFSPNGDGINDRFAIFGQVPNVDRIEELLIVDRWGGLLFQGGDFLPNDLSSGWDGRSKGKRLPAGVYGYLAKIRFLDGEVEVYSGEVVLLY
jgi:gliding motility-associated-like protein